MGVELNQSNSQLCVCQDVLGALGERVADSKARPELTGFPLEWEKGYLEMEGNLGLGREFEVWDEFCSTRVKGTRAWGCSSTEWVGVRTWQEGAGGIAHSEDLDVREEPGWVAGLQRSPSNFCPSVSRQQSWFLKLSFPSSQAHFCDPATEH